MGDDATCEACYVFERSARSSSQGAAFLTPLFGLDALAGDDLDAALAHFRAAEGYGRGVKEVCNNIGSVLAEYGHDPPAVDYYARAAGMDKHYALPRWNLFRLFKRHGRYAEAREQLEQIIAATPDDFRAYGEMGFLLHNHLDDPDAAVRFWHESLRIKPDQPQIIEALASRSTSLDR